MNRINLFFVLWPVLLLFSCGGGGNDEETSASARNITGTVNISTTDVVIGTFHDDYWFSSSYSGDEDVVASEFSTTPPAEFSPLGTALPDGSGFYNLSLPSDPSTLGCVIAWVDSDGDGKFDLGTESGYFPVKTIDGTDYVIDSFGWIDLSSLGYGVYYLVSYGSGNNDGFDIVGNGGFNFSID